MRHRFHSLILLLFLCNTNCTRCGRLIVGRWCIMKGGMPAAVKGTHRRRYSRAHSWSTQPRAVGKP